MAITPPLLLKSPFATNGIPRNELTSAEVGEHFYTALEMANRILVDRGIKLVHIDQVPSKQKQGPIDPDHLQLLGIIPSGKEDPEPIDIIDLKALQEDQIKTPIDLHNEMVKKVEQHLAAKETNGIVFSSSGSKFDTRYLKTHSFAIDEKGYATVDSHRLAFQKAPETYVALPAAVLRSYTILRLVEDASTIHIIDDHDFVRSDYRGMFIHSDSVHQIAVDQLLPACHEDAKAYEGDYLLVDRETLTVEKKERLYSMMYTFSRSLHSD